MPPNRLAPDRLEFERQLLRRDLRRLVGIDEAGRGPLAGPVVAAAVALPTRWLEHRLPDELADLNDSKQLTETARERFFERLTTLPDIEYGIAVIDADLIDQLNILRATHLAMLQAGQRLNPPPDHVLVDGLRVGGLPWPQTPVVKGDARSYSIAAASILAKVTRDRLMTDYDRQYPGYGFAQHKGYGTADHLKALRALGPCPLHRRSFAPLKSVQAELFPRSPCTVGDGNTERPSNRGGERGAHHSAEDTEVGVTRRPSVTHLRPAM